MQEIPLLISHLTKGKMRHRDVKEPDQGHTASKQQNRDANPSTTSFRSYFLSHHTKGLSNIPRHLFIPDYAWTWGSSNELDMGPALGELEVFRQEQRKQVSSVWRDVPRARRVQRHCV